MVVQYKDPAPKPELSFYTGEQIIAIEELKHWFRVRNLSLTTADQLPPPEQSKQDD